MIIPAMDFAYKGSLVRRFHTYNVLRQETNGHHMHGVAYLVDLIYPDARKELLQAALRHDTAEGGSASHGGVGDTPGHIKRLIPGFREALKQIEDQDMAEVGLRMPELTDEEKRQLKFADNAHGCLFCLEEAGRGNRIMLQPLGCYVDWMVAMGPFFSERERKVLDEIRRREHDFIKRG